MAYDDYVYKGQQDPLVQAMADLSGFRIVVDNGVSESVLCWCSEHSFEKVVAANNRKKVRGHGR